MGKKNKESLGRALIKDRFAKNRHRRHVENNTMVRICKIKHKTYTLCIFITISLISL